MTGSGGSGAARGPVAGNEWRFGESRQGRPLVAHLLGHGAEVTLVFGGFHGDERATRPLVERLREELGDRPEMLAERQVVLVPCLNPDGWEAGTRQNAAGVDLNRNFPVAWQPGEPGGRYYPGEGPLSEPEARAVLELLERCRPHKMVSLHQPMHCLNWNGPRAREVAEEMSRHNAYPVLADIGYPTPGSFGEYCAAREESGVVTMELPEQSAEAAWSANREALLAAIAFPIGG